MSRDKDNVPLRLTAEDVVRRIATECIFIDQQGQVGIRLAPAAAVPAFAGTRQTQLPQFRSCMGRKAAEMLGFVTALRICGAKFLGFFRQNTRIILEHRRSSVVLYREQCAAPCWSA
jgi:hypothetical protein